MANTPDLTQPCLDVGPIEDDAVLPVSPYYALRYQFGMLLGVEDFETAQAYPRGKMRLHNAWLHGAGVVWGFGVSAPPMSATDSKLRGEILVDPGLALDAMGHELHLDGPACVNVGAWYQQHAEEAEVMQNAKVSDIGAVDLTLRVELRFKACLTRQVPAMSEPCNGGASDTAYSRAFETVEIKLLPGALVPAPPPYHRLRLLFGVDPANNPAGPAEADVATSQAKITAAAAADQQLEFLKQFRALAAFDEMEMKPGKRKDGTPGTLFPVAEDAPIVLANLLTVHLEKTAAGFSMTSVDIHNEVRPTHIATSTIQELNCCANPGVALPPAPAPAPVPPAPAPTADADGPRFDRDNVKLERKQLTLQSSLPIDPATLDPSAFSLTQLDSTDGWSLLEVRGATLDKQDDSGKTLKIDLKDTPRGAILRLIARGTGPEPLMGTTGIPLGGRFGDSDGSDFVHMWKRS